jgi:hypothetical protein
MTAIDPTDSGRLLASYHLDPDLATRPCQRAVSCDKWSIQHFGKSQIGGIISRQTVAHLPDAGKQDEMRVARKRKINEIGQRFAAPFRGDDGGAHVAAQDLRNFEVEKMRSMERFVGGKDEAVHTAGCGGLEENFKDRGSVNDDQRRFLSPRTAAAGAGYGRTGWRLESRFRISSSVGRSKAWRSSRSR